MDASHAMQAQNNKKVFISYSTGGNEGKFVHELVEQLYQDLSANDCQVWNFERESIGGSRFQDQYKQAVKDCDFFILLCNDSARKSVYIEEEIQTALGYAKPIIQVLLDNYGPHPILKKENLTPIPYNDEHRHNRIYLLAHVLKAIGIVLKAPPGDKFSALGLLWKVYQRDPMYYPIYGQDTIRLLGPESSRMDIQTETDLSYAAILLSADSNWRTDTSVGLEKWYGRERHSISLQNGHVWIRSHGTFGSNNRSHAVKNWEQIKAGKSAELEIRWNELDTTIFVNRLQICRTKTRVHKPLHLRLNADFNDYLILRHLDFPSNE